jgi:hypothetical protein
MGKKKRRSRKASPLPADLPESALGLDAAVWSVGVGYRKGILSGSRYTTVSVRHRPTGRSRQTSFYAAGKAVARREAAAFVRRFVEEVEGR